MRASTDAVGQFVQRLAQQDQEDTDAHSDQPHLRVNVDISAQCRSSACRFRCSFTSAVFAGSSGLGQDAGHVVRASEGEEPAAHGGTSHALGGEFGHHAQPDGGEEQLACSVQHVKQHECQNRELRRFVDEAECIHRLHNQVAESKLDDAEAELHWNRWVFADVRQLDPHDGEDGSEDEDERWVEELRGRSAHLPAENDPVDVPVSKEGEGGARLFKACPEDDVEHEQNDHHDHAVAGNRTFFEGFRKQVVDDKDGCDCEQIPHDFTVAHQKVEQRDGGK